MSDRQLLNIYIFTFGVVYGTVLGICLTIIIQEAIKAYRRIKYKVASYGGSAADGEYYGQTSHPYKYIPGDMDDEP